MSQLAAVAGPADKFLSATTGSVRMLAALLAACDPCGHIESGGSADDYTGLAWQIEAALQAGMSVAQIKALLQAITDTDSSTRFCEAAVDWWVHSGASRKAAARPPPGPARPTTTANPGKLGEAKLRAYPASAARPPGRRTGEERSPRTARVNS